jgi:hypothetical protein
MELTCGLNCCASLKHEPVGFEIIGERACKKSKNLYVGLRKNILDTIKFSSGIINFNRPFS